MKDLKQYYCKVTQEEANEARELLIKANEKIWKDCLSFEVYYGICYLQCDSDNKYWFTDSDIHLCQYTKTTYPQFKQMLIDKIKENEKRDII